mmetsp:Transcript_35900/g.120052  ORF Transcript_35900/g.120052 Transcript_35900/m.120052 type:complete len:263 (+) Transcript_35900:327-1115(+)
MEQSHSREVAGRRPLVPVDRVVNVKVLDLLRDLLVKRDRRGGASRTDRRRERASVGPAVTQLEEGRERPAPLYLAAVAQRGQLVVRHAHVLFIELRAFGARQLGAGGRVGDAREHPDPSLAAGPLEESLEVALVDAADRVQVCGRAVVLCVVAAQRLVDVRGTEHEQRAARRRLVAVGRPRHQLRHEVRHHHPGAGLDVLQRQVLRELGVVARLGLHLWPPPDRLAAHAPRVHLHRRERLADGRPHAVDADGGVQAAYLFGE